MRLTDTKAQFATAFYQTNVVQSFFPQVFPTTCFGKILLEDKRGRSLEAHERRCSSSHLANSFKKGTRMCSMNE